MPQMSQPSFNFVFDGYKEALKKAATIPDVEDEEDEMLVREVFSKVAAAGPSSAPPIRQDSPEEDVK